MLLMVEKAIRGGINHTIHCKLNNLTSVTLAVTQVHIVDVLNSRVTYIY